MRQLNNIRSELVELEEERLLLSQKKESIVPWLIGLPMLAFFLGATISGSMGGAIFGLFLFGGMSGIYYWQTCHHPFNILKEKVRKAMLGEFMRIYHPETHYTYQLDGLNGERIINKSGLISADSYDEEDVIQGSLNNAKFYLSEVNLSNKSKNSSSVVFTGILFRIKLPNKDLPEAQIQSEPDMLRKMFSGFIKHEHYGFWLETNDFLRFEEELEPLFPFIKYLMEQQRDVRIKTKGNEIVIMLESDMKFLDDPVQDISNTFFNENYYNNLGRQLNSLLYIVESFVNELDTSAIEERLELKPINFEKEILTNDLDSIEE